MSTHKFNGKWITHRDFSTLKPINVFHRYLEKPDFDKSAFQNKHILFRKKFNLTTCENTKIYISADDYYKLYINGVFVGCGPKSSYIHNYCYNEYDISEFVKNGENTLAVHTYYQGLINRVFISGDNRHGLICDIIQNDNLIVSSDEGFLCEYHSGYKAIKTIGYDTQFTEKYNANSKEDKFYMTDFDDSCWKFAKHNKMADYTLKNNPERNLVFEKIRPEIITKTSYGYFIDFGKNYVGYLNFNIQGGYKDKVKIRYGQELKYNGRVQYKMRANCNYEDAIILSGTLDNAEFFDYKAFRYVEIITRSNTKISDVYLLARHYPFECKVNIQNHIFDLCLHTLKYGVQETVQDCPDREKGAYLGDGCYIALAHGKLTDEYTLFKELVKDALESKFISPSLATCLNCSLIQEIAEFPLIMVYCLEIYNKLTGDKKFVDSVLPEIKNVLDYYKNNYTNDDGLICRTDKWCVVEWPDNFRNGYDVDLSQDKAINDTHSVINAYYYKALCSFNNLANENIYDTESIKRQYIKAFYIEKDKRFKDSVNSNHQSFLNQLFSLSFGLCNDENKKEILSLINEKGIDSVNIFGSFPFLYYLYETGNKELLTNQFANENTWLKMISEGATTTCECWGKDLKWNTSLFHLTHSSAVMFMDKN